MLLESEAVSPTVAAALAAATGAKGKAAPLALEIAGRSLLGHPDAPRARSPGPPTRSRLAEAGPRTKHDVFTSVVKTSARGEIAAVTSQGRMLRLQVMDMPVLPPTSGTPNMAGGVPAKDFITLLKGETLVAFAPLDQVLAIGTAQGVVKRVQPDYPLNREDWEVIALKDKDTVVGVAPAGSDDDDLVFLTRQAQLLRFGAAVVRPQGRTAGGMAGIKLAAGDRVLFFGTVAAADDAAVVVTIAGTNGALPGTAPGNCQGDGVRRIPRQGTGNRRGPGAPVPQGRRHAAAGLGRARSGEGVLRWPAWQGHSRRTRPPGRIRHSAVPGRGRDRPKHGVG